jgi:hypothetical protein
MSIFSFISCSTKWNKKKNKYEWNASGNAPELYPTKLYFGNFKLLDETTYYIPPKSIFASVWGRTGSVDISDDDFKLPPKAIDIVWYAILEDKFYSVEAPLPSGKIEELLKLRDEETNEYVYSTIVAGMAPYGDLAVWLVGGGIITEVAWINKGELADVEWKDFLPHSALNREQYVDFIQKHNEKAYANFLKNGLPHRMLFDGYMQRFNYRFNFKFENENTVLERIQLFYFNGELNSMTSGEHNFFAMRAKPYKAVLNWSIGETQYSGYFWADEKKIIETFSNFYAEDPSKEGNFVIEVGKSNDQFKFVLQDDTTVVEIPVNEMEIIVFKDKYEFWRSKNYDKPPGGWSD